MEINIKKLEELIKVKLSSSEQKDVENFILNNLKEMESLEKIDTEGIKLSSFPFEKQINFDDLRKDESSKQNFDLIKSNTKNIEDRYVVFSQSNNEKSEMKDFEEEELVILEKVSIEKNNPTNNIMKNKKIAIKDNYAMKDFNTTSGTLMLENFNSNYNSTIVEKILDAQGEIKYKTNLDELAMGGTGTFSRFGIVKNPIDSNYIIGGSSSGSAHLVATDQVDIAIGSDTGDSVRKPAAFAGIIGFKPTWSTVSRYGLFDYCPSLDHVAWFSKNIENIALTYDALTGKDDNDMTSCNSKTNEFNKNLSSKLDNYTIAMFPKEFFNFKNKEIEKNYLKTIDLLKKKNLKVVEISFDEVLLKVMNSLYQIISFTEAASCNFNLQGINFGTRGTGDDVIIDARTKSFGLEVKKRFIFGAFMLERENQKKYFEKAKKIRTLIIKEFNQQMKNKDALIMPTILDLPPLIKNVSSFNIVSEDDFSEELMLIGNFVGAPSISVPNGKVGKFVSSINITSKVFEDQKVLNIAKFILEETNE